jgi:hypothetical protein
MLVLNPQSGLATDLPSHKRQAGFLRHIGEVRCDYRCDANKYQDDDEFRGPL